MTTVLRTLFARTRRAPRIADRPLAEAAFVAVDTELTGLDERHDAIVSLGAVRMERGAIALGGAGTFHVLVHPACALSPESVVVHGITPSEVEARPEIDAVLADFLAFVGGAAIVVGHFVALDIAFLDRELRRLRGGRGFDLPAVDTMALHAWLQKRRTPHQGLDACRGNLRLTELAACFGIPVTAAHTALGDAFVTAQLLQRLLPLLESEGVTTTDGLLRVGDPHKGGDWRRSHGEISNF